MVRAMAKVGLANGLVVGLATHWLFWAPLTELVYCIELPGLVISGLGAAAVLALLAGVLTIGPRSVHLAGEEARTVGAAIGVGSGAGLLAGLCVCLIVGLIGGWLVLSGAPLVCDSMGATELGTAAAREALAQAAREAVPDPLVVAAICLTVGALLGGFGGLVYALFLRRQGPGCSEMEAPPDGEEA
jgi:hypothetical protein